jgi:hypothetical protein
LRETVKFGGFLLTKGNVTHSYLGNNIAAILEQLMNDASLTEEMSGNSLSTTNSIIALIKQFYFHELMISYQWEHH